MLPRGRLDGGGELLEDNVIFFSFSGTVEEARFVVASALLRFTVWLTLPVCCVRNSEFTPEVFVTGATMWTFL
jgi:hypothetical protein